MGYSCQPDQRLGRFSVGIYVEPPLHHGISITAHIHFLHQSLSAAASFDTHLGPRVPSYVEPDDEAHSRLHSIHSRTYSGAARSTSSRLHRSLLHNGLRREPPRLHGSRKPLRTVAFLRSGSTQRMYVQHRLVGYNNHKDW